MRRYYARRAAYYERVYHKPERQHDLRAMEAWLAGAFAGRQVLEVACGTGWWTPHGARDAASWLATDLNSETLAVAQARPMPLGERRFEAAFAGCWWSHVPLSRLPGWLEMLHGRLPSGARVVFLDNSYVQTSSTPISRRDEAGNTYQQRTLDDGSVHEVLKNFPGRDEAVAALGARARQPQWTPYTHYWVLSYELA